MKKAFAIGQEVTVLANIFSKWAPDHHEQPWQGTIIGISETPKGTGVIRSYDVKPKDGKPARNVHEARLKP